jgi:hypothetical protein
LLILFGWDYLNGKVPHFDAQNYIGLLIIFVASSMGTVGFKELDRGGYRKVKRNLGVFFIALLVLPLILILISRDLLHWQIVGLDITYQYFVIPFFVLWAAIFPLALYLNRKQAKTTPQPTVPNAS